MAGAAEGIGENDVGPGVDKALMQLDDRLRTFWDDPVYTAALRW